MGVSFSQRTKMKDKRFDHRTKEQFKKDIMFGTMVEKFLIEAWVEQPQVYVHKIEDNGVANDGRFIKHGKTGGADYKVTFDYHNLSYADLPLEVKWVPTAGKFTLKTGDLRQYVREEAAILFIYNTRKTSLRPKEREIEEYKNLILSYARIHAICWGIMFPSIVKNLSENYNEKRIPYMGNKPGIVIPQDHFHMWFTRENFYDPKKLAQETV